MASLFIPNDLILDGILPWLPAKSIGRFRCVCKSWYHQTSTPSFIKTHQELALQRNQFSLLLNYGAQHMMLKDRLNGSVIDFDLHLYELFGSCNGIVCYVKTYTPTNSNEVFLLNPCTGEFKFLEFPYRLLTSVMEPTDRYRYYKLYGFGYDSEEEDYKLVVMFRMPMEVCIHSFNNTSCITVSAVACQNVNGNESPGIYVNGGIYWLTNHQIDSNRHVILSFNIKNKVLQEFDLPTKVESAGWYVDGMAVLGGKLCISSTQKFRDPTCCIQIWVMQQHGVDHTSWSQLFSLDKQSTFSLSYKAYLSKEGQILLDYKYVHGEILLDKFGEDKLMYHPQRRTIRLIQL